MWLALDAGFFQRHDPIRRNQPLNRLFNRWERRPVIPDSLETREQCPGQQYTLRGTVVPVSLHASVCTPLGLVGDAHYRPLSKLRALLRIRTQRNEFLQL